VSTAVLNLLPATESDRSSGQLHLTDDQGRPYDLQVIMMPSEADRRLVVSLNAEGEREMRTSSGDVRMLRSSRQLITASVNLQSGKSVVLGSTRLDGTSGALILVVTASFDP
jgi:hypothetical protein